MTYCLHVMVRYELEKRLMDGSLEVKDLPAAWNAQMKELLGVDVPDDAHGVLQDIHWAGGDLGYFPSYALGTAYGAQMMASMRRSGCGRSAGGGQLGPHHRLAGGAHLAVRQREDPRPAAEERLRRRIRPQVLHRLSGGEVFRHLRAVRTAGPCLLDRSLLY